MSRTGKVEEKISELADEVAGGLGYEVWDVELHWGRGRALLRVTIEKEGGVTLDDCTSFSRDFGAILDVENPIESPYTLEVSSPGLDRPLKGPRDFTRSVGKLARVVTREKVEGRNLLIGTVLGVEDHGVRLGMGEKEVFIDMRNISRARLEIDIG
jgi:ribosome maturation factor RimP